MARFLGGLAVAETEAGHGFAGIWNIVVAGARQVTEGWKENTAGSGCQTRP
jgi:hypothetical protein